MRIRFYTNRIALTGKYHSAGPCVPTSPDGFLLVGASNIYEYE